MSTKPRRPRGDGGIYYDEKADRWVGQFDAGRTDTGKRRRVKVTGDSRADVAEKLRQRRRALEAGDQAPATMSVKNLLDEWEAAVLPTMSPNTAVQPVLGELKTGRSRRSLGMPPQVITALRAHRARWAEERMALGWSAEWSELVFVTESGTPIDASNLRRELATIAKWAGVGHLRPYDLRHTCASLLAEAGVPLEHIADYLGHDGIRMARTVYVHALSPTVNIGIEPLAAALGGS